MVIQSKAPISCHWGLTGDEIRLASEAAHYLARMRLPLYFGTVADAFEQERAMRDMIRLFKSIIAKEQKRAGIECCLWLEVLEGTPAVRSHILFPLNDDAKRIVSRMMASERFPGDMLDIRRSNPRAFVAYCSKERTPQAKFVGVGTLAKRLPGSHHLGEGGGDRVRVSKALMGGLVDAGVVLPHRRVYAARALPPMIEERPVRHIIIDGTDLFGGLPEPTAPSKREPQKRPKIAERYGAQEALPLDCAPTVVELLPRLGRTHHAIGEKLGISRQQASNIIAGRFGPSRRVARRVLELVRAA